MTKEYNDNIMTPEEYRKKRRKHTSDVAMRRKRRGKKFNHKGSKIE